MIRDVDDIKVIDTLFRVSSIGQEREGESLVNQRRTVETLWAEPRGIRVRRRIEVTESGKSALRLKGAGFEFSRRAQYTDLIVEYQGLPRSQLPDACVIDWADRWSRSPLELLGLIEAFSSLGIRLLAIGDDLELTDPRQRLVTTIKSAVAGEQLRINSEKVREAFASRRARGRWQTGRPADGFRNHSPRCKGMVEVERETPDGQKKRFRVRACDCPTTVLHRDPNREATIVFIWNRLLKSPLSFEGIAAEVNAAGHVRLSNKPYVWQQVYQVGRNPHYAGIMTSDRFIRDPHDGRITMWRPLLEQSMVESPEAIPNPYITPEQFWDVWNKRFAGGRSQNIRRGSTNELFGILFCPECGTHMNSRREVYKTVSRFSLCRTKTCSANRHGGYIRVDAFGRALIEKLAKFIVLDDAAIAEALKLRRPTEKPSVLHRERAKLETDLRTWQNARHILIADRAGARISQKEYESELFAFRKDIGTAEERLRGIDTALAAATSKPAFGPARQAIRWLADRWPQLTVSERAEALRLLVSRVTFTPTRKPVVLEWGPAFRRQAQIRSKRGQKPA